MVWHIGRHIEIIEDSHIIHTVFCFWVIPFGEKIYE